MFEALAQNLVYGILVGALYGLAAVGLSLVFGVTKFLNVAHGELLMFGGYASFWLFTLWKVDPFLSLPLAIVFLLVIGAVLYKLLFARMVKLAEGDKIQNTLLVGFGLSLILQNLALRFWTADTRSITTFYSGAVFTIRGRALSHRACGEHGHRLCRRRRPSTVPAEDIHGQSPPGHRGKLGSRHSDGD